MIKRKSNELSDSQTRNLSQLTDRERQLLSLLADEPSNIANAEAQHSKAKSEDKHSPHGTARMSSLLYPDLDSSDFVTPRQRQILHYLVRGMTREAIATKLHLSRSTVNRDIREITSILGARSPEGLGALAYREGFLKEESLHFQQDLSDSLCEPGFE